MENVFIIEKQEPMESAPLKLPRHVRLKAKKMAQQAGIAESSLYRQIIGDFFSKDRQVLIDGTSGGK